MKVSHNAPSIITGVKLLQLKSFELPVWDTSRSHTHVDTDLDSGREVSNPADRSSTHKSDTTPSD